MRPQEHFRAFFPQLLEGIWAAFGEEDLFAIGDLLVTIAEM